MNKLLLCVTMLATSGMLIGASQHHSLLYRNPFKDLENTAMIAEVLDLQKGFKVNNISKKPLLIKVGGKNVLNDKVIEAQSFVGHEFEPITITLTYPSGPISYTVQAPQKGWLIANGGAWGNGQLLEVYDPQQGNAPHQSFSLKAMGVHTLPFTENPPTPELEAAD